MAQDKAPRERNKSSLHAGHRKRVRQRFLNAGLESFADHEVLEFLLFYAVPRRDVNETAHMLIDHFGSLSSVLDAPEEELCTVPGVGPHVAHFLSLLPEVLVQLSRHSLKEEHLAVLETPRDLEKVMAGRCPDCPMGHTLFILTNAKHEVVAIYAYKDFMRLRMRDIALHAVSLRATGSVLVERVEDCTRLPSPEKLAHINELAEGLEVLGTPVRDFFDVDFSGRPPRSYARSGQLLPLWSSGKRAAKSQE